MIYFVVYDPATGGIKQAGHAAYAPAAGTFDDFGTYLEHDLGIDPVEGYCVVDGQVVPKTTVVLLGPAPTPADGVTEAVVSGIPAGSTAFVNGANEGAVLAVDDGTLELTSAFPALFTVLVVHPTKWMEPVTVEFV